MQLRPGSRVPNRKPRPNPWTITGRPQWNTYAALDMNSVNTEIQIGKRKAGTHVGTGGGRKRKHLDPRNVCHRIRATDTHLSQMRKHYEQALRLCFKLDATDPDTHPNLYAMYEKQWTTHMAVLCENKQTAHLSTLVAAEQLRGQVRCKLYAGRAGLRI